MTAKKLAPWILSVAALLSLGLQAHAGPPVDATAVLTEAYYIKQAIRLLEGESQVLAGEPAPERIQEAAQALQKFNAAVEGKNVALVPQLEGIRTKLVAEPPDLEGARQAIQAAWSEALSTLAEKYTQVAEGAGDDWLRYTGWVELAVIRLQQADFPAAKESLWKASSFLANLDIEEAEVLKVFKDLAQRIGKGLMDQGKFEAAADHFSKMLLAPKIQWDDAEAQKAEQLQAMALGLAKFEAGDTEGAAQHLRQPAVLQSTTPLVLARLKSVLESAREDPALYPKALELAAAWRKIDPANEDVLKTVVSRLTAQDQAPRLTEWFQQTSDCGIKVYLVEALQRTSNEEAYLDLAQAALDCDNQNERAQSALAKANYRMAVQVWNGEIVRDRPKDSATAKPAIEKMRKHLGQAGENYPGALDLRKKVDDYAAGWSRKTQQAQQVASAQEQDLKGQCTHLYERAQWAQEMLNIIPISDFGSIVTDLTNDKAKCAPHLQDSQKKELDEWLSSLMGALPTRCSDESRRSRLPLNMGVTTKEELEQLRTKIRAVLEFCKSISETETERLAAALVALKQEIEKRS